MDTFKAILSDWRDRFISQHGRPPLKSEIPLAKLSKRYCFRLSTASILGAVSASGIAIVNVTARIAAHTMPLLAKPQSSR